MKKNDLKKLALMGISGGIILASQSNVIADETFSNTVSGHYLAGGCGSKCSQTAYNDRGFSNQGYFYNQDQDQNYYYQQSPTNPPQSGQNLNNRQNQSNNPNQRYNNQPNQSQNSRWEDNRNNQRQGNPYSGYLSLNDEATPATSEAQFKSQLSVQGKSDYDNLSTDAKANAIKMASHDCKGKNDCKGQNSCQTEKNACGGQGACKGQSTCKMSPDKAVKIASLKDKRASLNSSSSRSSGNY